MQRRQLHFVEPGKDVACFNGPLRTMKQAGDQRPFSPSGKNYYGVVECGQRPKSPKGHIFNTKAMPPTSADSLRDRTMPWINTIKSFLSSQ